MISELIDDIDNLTRNVETHYDFFDAGMRLLDRCNSVLFSITQNSPTWKDSPIWARYLALDGSLSWYWYENKPKLNKYGWVCEGRSLFAAPFRPDLWMLSLEEKPDEEEVL